MAPITIRCTFSNGAYHARASGYKATASSAESARKAAGRLIEKLRPGVVIDRIERVGDGANAALSVYQYHFKSNDITAYCFGSGHIQFGPSIPDGAIGIAVGDREKVLDIIEVTARLSRHDNETLFVPGVPEAQTQREGLTALARYIQYLGQRNEPGFRALGA